LKTVSSKGLPFKAEPFTRIEAAVELSGSQAIVEVGLNAGVCAALAGEAAQVEHLQPTWQGLPEVQPPARVCSLWASMPLLLHCQCHVLVGEAAQVNFQLKVEELLACGQLVEEPRQVSLGNAGDGDGPQAGVPPQHVHNAIIGETQRKLSVADQSGKLVPVEQRPIVAIAEQMHLEVVLEEGAVAV
ncbi:hypothetical protein TYRP_016319, partial [Tyrophagus putrescentiae]